MNVNSFELSLLNINESRVIFIILRLLLWLLTDAWNNPPDEDINRFVSSLMT